MSDPQFNEVETNNLESVGKVGKKKLVKKIKNSGVVYHADSAKHKSKRHGVRKFALVKQ